MSALLTGNLPLIADAPDGIRKLRGLILELAVRGKLVPQDPNDEPASELLKRIAAEKAQLVREEKIKKDKLSPPKHAKLPPFNLPLGWAWARLADTVAVVTDGDHQPPPKTDSGIPFLVIGDLNTGRISFNGCRFVSTTYFESLDWSKRPTTGDVLYTVTGSFGIPIPVVEKSPFCVQRHVAILKAATSSPVAYLLPYMQSLSAKAFAQTIATGTAQKTVPLSGLREMPIALPPVAEQRRIVAKVDELMALCDRLEAEQADAEAAHARLVDDLLAALTRSTDADDFAANWHRLAAHFDTLFTTEAAIDALKQTVLQLAVMGKLVPQDPDDEPASEFLTLISQERVQLEAKGTAKKWKPRLPVEGDEQPFELPNGWEWARLGDLGLLGSSSRVHQKDWTDRGVPFYRAREIVKLSQNGFVRNELYISEALFESLSASGLVPAENDLMVTGVGTIGVPYIVNKADKFYFKDASVLIFKNYHRLCAKYIFTFMTSPFWVNKIHEKSMGTTVDTLTIARANEVPFPLPPLAEQHRIVAKVDELMALCDRLKADLAAARQRQATLADTLIAAALEAA